MVTFFRKSRRLALRTVHEVSEGKLGSTASAELRFDEWDRIALPLTIPKEEIVYPGQSNDVRLRKGRSDGPSRDFDASAVTDLTLTASAADLHKSKLTAPLWSSEDPTDDRGAPGDADLVLRYEADLAQKDELINALVRELEQAVEQLDRFRRTGTDRSPENQPTTIFSPVRDPAETQIAGLDDLRQMAEQWHESQPASMLSRIETQLADVYDLINNLRLEQRAPADARHAEDRDERASASRDSVDIERANATIEESSSSWESIKRQILGEEPPPQPVEAPSDDIEVMKSVGQAPSPRDVDFGMADVEALRSAINERDEYIIQLNRIFRAKSAFTVPADWATLANVPAEMQVRVETLIQRLDVQVRLGEVEMSLERARVARERSQIQSEREQLEKHLRRLGVNSIAEIGNISAAAGSSPSDRRWMRFLGPSSK